MFVRNERHLQDQMFTTVDGLPSHLARRLAEGWAAAFYREYFCRIDEQPYAVLFSEEYSRPNIPINVLVGLEALKSGFNWSDEEMYDAFCFDLQVRLAVGYRNLHEGQFDLRTVYNFRRRLSEHMQQTGENLIEQSFEKVTDEQIEVFRLRTGKVRMDSSDIASNIRNMSRLHLLVEVVQRVHRMLVDDDRQRYADVFAPYMKGSSGQYVYRVKGDEGPAHMQRIGELMQEMLVKLADTYREHPTYRMLKRVFAEHFLVEESRLRLKVGKELSARSLNSPDDPEATFRKKNNCPHKGYVANVTETCDPSNPLQLIVLMQTKPNVTNDDDMLVEAVPVLKGRLGIDEINADGSYNSDESYKATRDNNITLIQTAIRGHSPHVHLGLDQFEIVIAPAVSATDAYHGLNGESSAVSQMGAASEPYVDGERQGTSTPDAANELTESSQADVADNSDRTNETATADEADATSGRGPHGQTVNVESIESKTEYKRKADVADNSDRTSETATADEADATSGRDDPAHGCSMTITCPHGQTVNVESVESKTEYKRYRAHFETGQCDLCPIKEQCPATETKTKRWRTLSFYETDIEIARRRKRIAQGGGPNLRVTIESTIASLKQPFNYEQLPVRGLFRVGMVLVGCAAMANVRRIHRYLRRKGAPKGTNLEGNGLEGTNHTGFLFFYRQMHRLAIFSNRLPVQIYAN